MYMPLKKYTVNEKFLDKIDTQEKAYFLGIMCADGYNFYPKTNQFGIDVLNKDIDILHKLREAISFSGDVKTYGHRSRLIVTSKPLAKRLSELGCFHRKTGLNTFPTGKVVPHKLKWHFIRGYFDGDGSISSWATKYYHTNKFGERVEYFGRAISLEFESPEGFNDSLNLFIENELGFRVKSLSFRRKAKTSSSLRYNGMVRVPKVYKKMYQDATIYLQRKKDKFKELKICEF